MAVTFADVLELPAGEPDDVVAYGTRAEQFGELWLPRDGSEARALVVFIHGGCWQRAYDIGHCRSAAQSLRDAGFSVWSLEYRRIGDAGGAWPGTFTDVGAGVDYVHELVKSRRMNSGAVVFMGHSAGGHLALWAAARSTLAPDHPFYVRNPVRPDGVVGLAAITDLRSYAAGTSSCETSTRDLLGGLPDQVSARYAAVSPLELLPLGVPTTLVAGTGDVIVAPQQAESFLSAAIAAGDRTRLRFVPGAGHFDFIHPGTLAWTTVLATLREHT